MRKRTIAVTVIKDWVESHNPNGKEKLIIMSQLSPSIIDKIVHNKYKSVPNLLTMKAICEAVEMPLDEVFPFKRKSS